MKTKASLLLLSAMLLTGCGSVRINRILSDPARYSNRNVQVEGRVVNVVGALNMGVYEVDDGTGKIYVVSSRGVPTRNARVRVDGRVQPGLNIMGRSLGTAIRESGHRVRF
jgi:hypothetical protein